MFEWILSKKSTRTKNFVWKNTRLISGPIHDFSSTLNSLHKIQCNSSSSKVLIWEVESSIKLGMFDRLKMMYVVQSSNRVMRTPFLFSASILFSAHHSNSILDFYFFIMCTQNMSHTVWVILNATVFILKTLFSRFYESRFVLSTKSWTLVRVFQKIMNSTGEWCPFEHINVGHELTKDTSRVHACFPAAPPEMEIEIPCPNNSTAYYWDRKIKHLTRKCQKNGTWATHEGHCGCHYDIFKWDRVAFYFSGFQKFKVLLGMVTFRKSI